MKKHKSMRLDEVVIRHIDAIACKENRSFTNMVEVILSEYVENTARLAVAKKHMAESVSA